MNSRNKCLRTHILASNPSLLRTVHLLLLTVITPIALHITSCDSGIVDLRPRAEVGICGDSVSYITLCAFYRPSGGSLFARDSIQERGVFRIDHESGAITFQADSRLRSDFVGEDGTSYDFEFVNGSWDMVVGRPGTRIERFRGVSADPDMSVHCAVRTDSEAVVFICHERIRSEYDNCEKLRRFDESGQRLPGELTLQAGSEISGYSLFKITAQDASTIWACTRKLGQPGGPWEWRTWRGDFQTGQWTSSVDGGFVAANESGALLELEAASSNGVRILISRTGERRQLPLDTEWMFGSGMGWIWDEASSRPKIVRPAPEPTDGRK